MLKSSKIPCLPSKPYSCANKLTVLFEGCTMPSLVVFRFLSADGVDRVTSALFNVAFVWCNKCGAQCQGSSVPDSVTSCLFREARGQGTPPQASSGSSRGQPECSGGPTATPGRVNRHEQPALWQKSPPSSLLVSGTSMQWLKTQT